MSIIPKFVSNYIVNKAFSGSFRTEMLRGVGSMTARWMTLNDNKAMLNAFQTVPDINEVVHKKAKGYSRIKYLIEKKTSKGVEIIRDHPALTLMNKPNVLQSGSAMRLGSYIDRDVFGDSFYFCLKRGNQEISYKNIEQIFSLPAAYTLPNWTGRIYEQFRLEDIIQNYTVDMRGFKQDFPTENVLHLKRPNIINPINGRSPLSGEQWTISSLKALYESDNVVIHNHGSMGMITSQEGDATGILPISKDKIKEIQEDLGKYKLKWGSFQYMIARGALKYQNMIAPIKDLQYDEKMNKYRMRIIDALSYQKELMANPISDPKNTNRVQAMTALYTEALMPDFWEEADAWTTFLKLDLEGMRLIPDISKIEALQGNLKEKSEAYSKKNESLKIQYMSGIITMNEWLNRLPEPEPKSESKLADKYITELSPEERSIILQLPIIQPTQD